MLDKDIAVSEIDAILHISEGHIRAIKLYGSTLYDVPDSALLAMIKITDAFLSDLQSERARRMKNAPAETRSYTQMKFELEEAGYSRDMEGYYQSIDQDIAVSTLCPTPCGQRRYYEAWTIRKDGKVTSYRAIAVCKIGHAQEF